MRKKKKDQYITYGAQVRKKPNLGMKFIMKWSIPGIILVTTAVVYVWQKNTLISFGYRMSELRREISAAEAEELKLQARLMNLQRPQRLKDEVEARKLGLQEVSPSQLITLVTPRPISLPSAEEKTTGYPPAAPWPFTKLSAATPHRENSVSR